MPHINDEAKARLEETKRIQKMGDLCYAFAEGAKVEYKREPKWGSIHNIARALFVNPYHESWSHEIIQKYGLGVTQQDVRTAAFLCLLEFYRIVGGRYEDGMIEQNGNVFAGLPIPSLLHEGNPVNVSDGRVLATPPPATPEALTEVDEVKRGRGRPKKVTA